MSRLETVGVFPTAASPIRAPSSSASFSRRIFRSTSSVVFFAAIVIVFVNVSLLVWLDHSDNYSRLPTKFWPHLRSRTSVDEENSSNNGEGYHRRMAVVVPTHAGDFNEALDSLQKWPTVCSPITKASVDLVLYKAEAEDGGKSAEIALPILEATAGKCFANTKIVFGALSKEVRTACQCNRADSSK